MVAYLALALYIGQVLVPLDTVSPVQALVLLASVPFLALFGREVVVVVGATWLAPPWTRWLLALALILNLFTSAVLHVLGVSSEPLGTLLFVLAGAIMAVHYTRRPDFATVTLVVGFSGILLMVAAGHLLLEVADFGGYTLNLFLLAIVCLATTTAMAKDLMTWRRHWSGIR